MSDPTPQAQICYLLAFPHVADTVLEPIKPIQGLKDAPYFQPVTINVQSLATESLVLEGVTITVQRQVYDKRVQLVECYFVLPDVLGGVATQTCVRLEEALRARLVPPENLADGLFEEYTMLLVQGVAGTPDLFIQAHDQQLARFLRPQREIFSPYEVEEILLSRARYSEQDLTLVDWDGAIIIAPDGDFQSDIELLKIGNYQLLRYRILDKLVDANLQTVGRNFQASNRPSLLPNRSRRVLRLLLEQRLSLALDFERIDQNLLLIGDWYTAKLYHVIHDEFYLDDWKEAIKKKLDSLESVIEIIQANFTVSWASFIDLLQILGWLLLLIGYIILFFVDLQAYLP